MATGRGGEWRRLIEEFTRDSRTTETEFGLRVRLNVADGTKRDVEIHLTPRQWAMTVGIIWSGDASGAAKTVRSVISRAGFDERFLLWENYELHPSSAPPEQTR